MNNILTPDLDHILNHTRDLWEQLRGERLFLSGGSGFFGAWLLESFLWANQRLDLGASASILIRDPRSFVARYPHLANKVTHVRGDLCDFNFPNGTFSHIIHAASGTSMNSNPDSLLTMLDTITLGTRRMLEFSQVCGAAKFLFTSSGAVYGKQPASAPRLNENDPTIWMPNEILSAQKIYRQGKLLSELQCEIFANHSTIDITIGRCFAFVGPYQPLNSQFAIANFIRDGLQANPIQVNGDGTPIRSYLYAADLAIWLITILFQGKAGRPYNVGSSEQISIGNLAALVSRHFKPIPEILIAHQPQTGLAPEYYVPSIERARSELGLQPWIGLDDAINRTIEWHSKTWKR